MPNPGVEPSSTRFAGQSRRRYAYCSGFCSGLLVANGYLMRRDMSWKHSRITLSLTPAFTIDIPGTGLLPRVADSRRSALNHGDGCSQTSLSRWCLPRCCFGVCQR